MARTKAEQYPWTPDDLKLLNDAKAEYKGADAVKRLNVADTVARQIQEAKEAVDGSAMEGKLAQALFTSVRGWLNARCKASRKTPGPAWKGVKPRLLFIQHNKLTIKLAHRAKYEKLTGDRYPYTTDGLQDTPLPDLDENDLEVLKEAGIDPEGSEDLEDLFEDDGDGKDPFSDSDDDNADSDDDDDIAPPSRKSGRKGAAGTKPPTAIQKLSNKVFASFQETVTELWNALAASERRKYRIRAYLNRELGPSALEQAEMADKELPSFLERMSLDANHKFNARLIITVVHPDKNRVLHSWTTDHGDNLGGTSFTTQHPTLFKDSGVAGIILDWARREFNTQDGRLRTAGRRQGTRALMQLPKGRDGVELLDPAVIPPGMNAKPYLVDMMRSYFIKKYGEASPQTGRPSLSWQAVSTSPDSYFDSHILPSQYMALVQEPTRLTVPKLRFLLGYLYERQQVGQRPAFRFDYFEHEGRLHKSVALVEEERVLGLIGRPRPIKQLPKRDVTPEKATVVKLSPPPPSFMDNQTATAGNQSQTSAPLPPAHSLMLSPEDPLPSLVHGDQTATAGDQSQISSPPADFDVNQNSSLVRGTDATSSPAPVPLPTTKTAAADSKDKPRRSAMDLIKSLQPGMKPVVSPTKPAAITQTPVNRRKRPSPAAYESPEGKRNRLDGIELLPEVKTNVRTRSQASREMRRTRQSKKSRK
ncbi:hypothetical protein CC1G_05495 [Coprinopsis cinerea okayama7|uniref:Uncharacterized protein n=1 Tax=Coprinopsis cinerea (strain Okayama-7 / 130 / ATCC MYA-4618 / FGSC 9003) TaxID=240176 RepID=A8P5H1_COPC7|nr:hypothetical protein CC1G_05495 [Coprinopsis cinerea okayama7\|eukprot:XP_001838942.1 hypothetical protein CC1G_05495 [Coprinopsis cinerea okayama7\